MTRDVLPSVVLEHADMRIAAGHVGPCSCGMCASWRAAVDRRGHIGMFGAGITAADDRAGCDACGESTHVYVLYSGARYCVSCARRVMEEAA